MFGIFLSLCANVASAAQLSVFAVVVAARPPLAPPLVVEPRDRDTARGVWLRV